MSWLSRLVLANECRNHPTLVSGEEVMSASRVCELNDAFRSTLTGGRVMLTSAVQRLSSFELGELLKRVRSFRSFGKDNDPNGEHDFGALDLFGQKFFWKIDYYDTSLEYGSPDPSDPSVTTRVLTIMRADEY